MRRHHDPDRNKPYPELVEAIASAGAWEVRDSRELRGSAPDGLVDLTARRLYVPFEPRARATVRHELGHVRWSPPRHPDLDYPRVAFLAVEDARINLGLAAVGLPVHLDARGRTRVAYLAAQDVADGRDGDYLLRSVAALGTDVAEAVLEAGRDGPWHVVDAARRSTGRVLQRLVEAAREAGSVVAPVEAAIALGRELARELRLLGIEAPDQLPAWTEPPAEREPGPPGPRPKDGGDVASGRLQVVPAPLSVPIVARARGRRCWRPAEEGSVVRFLHRWSVDGRIFRRAVRQRGGTVLVDTSGSMSFAPEDVDRIVRATSAATRVAIYSGSGSEGELRVVADGGRRAAAEHLRPFARGNVVDEPALAWLAQQPAPRVWISDGGVTGVDDTPSAELRRRCARILARGHIRRVATVADAVAALAGRTAAIPARAS